MKTVSSILTSRTAAARGRFRSHAGRFIAAATLGLAVHCSVATTNAAVIAFGTVTDPAGDSVDGKADITSASIAIDDSGSITFSVLFANGSFTPPEDSLLVLLDLDNNAATGPASVIPPGLGIDAFLSMPLGAPDMGLLALWNGTTFTGSPITLNHTSTVDSYTVTLPISLFGTLNPPISFSVSSSAPDVEISSVFQDATPIGLVTGRGPGPTPGVPDSGSSALLFSAATLGLMAGNHLRRRRAGQTDTANPSLTPAL